MIFHKVNFDLTDKQLKNLANKKAINIKHNQMGQGIHVIHLSDANMKHVDKCSKNKKGVRVKLNDDEFHQNMEDGEGIGRFFKNLGRKIKSVAKPVLNYAVDHPELAAMALEGAGINSINNLNNNIIMSLRKGSAEMKEIKSNEEKWRRY